MSDVCFEFAVRVRQSEGLFHFLQKARRVRPQQREACVRLDGDLCRAAPLQEREPRGGSVVSVSVRRHV